MVMVVCRNIIFQCEQGHLGGISLFFRNHLCVCGRFFGVLFLGSMLPSLDQWCSNPCRHHGCVYIAVLWNPKFQSWRTVGRVVTWRTFVLQAAHLKNWETQEEHYEECIQ